jgi:hypothetical protein
MHQIGLQSGLSNPAIQSSNTLDTIYQFIDVFSFDPGDEQGYHEVEKFILHQSYKVFNEDYDIGLIQMAGEPIKLSPKVMKFVACFLGEC